MGKARMENLVYTGLIEGMNWNIAKNRVIKRQQRCLATSYVVLESHNCALYRRKSFIIYFPLFFAPLF